MGEEKRKFDEPLSQEVNVKQLNHKENEELKRLPLKAGQCLNNSYEIANKIKGANMVEGYLVTRLNDGDIQAVGHVWNEIEGNNVDYSSNLIETDQVEKHIYYSVKTYSPSNKSTKTQERQSYDYLKREPTTKEEQYIVFKTDVKEKEKEFREYLNKKK